MKNAGKIHKHTKFHTDSLKYKKKLQQIGFNFHSRRVLRGALQISILNSRKNPGNA